MTADNVTPDSQAVRDPAACLNCGHVFAPHRLHYCPECGQETNIKPPTLREFAQQFGGSYIAAEGALWRTLKLLLLKPGALTCEYLQGRRKRYVLPLRLFLTISVVVLLLLRTVAVVDLAGDQASQVGATPPRTVTIYFGIGTAGFKEGQYFCNDMPVWLCKRVQQRLSNDPRKLIAQFNASGERLIGNLGHTMFVLLPAFALMLRALYFRRGLRYTEHLVFALHLHAFWFLMLGLVLPEVGWLTTVAEAAVPLYLVLALHRVYGGRWWLLGLRTALLALGYGVMLTLVGSFMWLLFLVI